MVELRRLGKTFGPIVAVDDVSFTVGQGEVLGFLGPNGAGKSTTMKMITGFLTPTRGTVKVNGFDVQEQPLEAKKSLGYLPEGAPAYGEMTPLSFLVVHRRNARLSWSGVAAPGGGDHGKGES